MAGHSTRGQESPSEPARRICDGLAQVGLVLRSAAWREAWAAELTPTQPHILLILHARPSGVRPTEVARLLGVRLPTVSVATLTLVNKHLVLSSRARGDRRARSLTLTRLGRQYARASTAWPEPLARAVDLLPGPDKEVLHRLLERILRDFHRRDARAGGGLAP